MGIEIPGRLRRRRRHASSTPCSSVEELSRVDPSVGVLVDVQNTLVINAVLRWASPELKARLLPALATRQVGAYALSEAASGSDAFALQTRARPGRRRLRAFRGASSGSPTPTRPTSSSCSPRSIRRPAIAGITAFLVERGTPGFTVGKKEDKLGIRASSTCELIFEECRVPAVERHRRGRQGLQGRDRNAERRPHRHRRADARAWPPARSITRSRYTKERKQFGKAIADFQGVQFQLARAATDIEAARLLVYNAARLRDLGQPFLTEAAMCKIFASEVAERAASLAVNLFGGNGFVKEYPVEKLYRDAKIGQIYEGTSNLQLQTIAKQILA